jgi:hypothetical protein
MPSPNMLQRFDAAHHYHAAATSDRAAKRLHARSGRWGQYSSVLHPSALVKRLLQLYCLVYGRYGGPKVCTCTVSRAMHLGRLAVTGRFGGRILIIHTTTARSCHFRGEVQVMRFPKPSRVLSSAVMRSVTAEIAAFTPSGLK